MNLFVKYSTAWDLVISEITKVNTLKWFRLWEAEGSRAFPVIGSWNKCIGLKPCGFLKRNIIIKMQNNKLMCSHVIAQINVFTCNSHIWIRLPPAYYIVSMVTDQMTSSQISFSYQPQQKPTTLLISDITNKANNSILTLLKC